ncbi:MAG TPA: APC family permease [Kofleriaceae bacterium]|nr:APC family permease [Kofleriaceae bacterium]
MSSSGSAELKRVLGTPSAVLLGLGSIIGTGIFVSIATATAVAGSGVLVAVALGAVVAACNGLSSAQLAAAHPVSGGTYEYGYRYLGPWSGRLAGASFVIAKAASAATAALGCAAYVWALADVHASRIPLALAIAVALTLLVVGGMARSARINAVIVGVTLVGLATFVVSGVPHVTAHNLSLDSVSARGVAHATALFFVAYTGYGRIATLGEEVRDPRHTVPRAIVIALVVTMLLYLAVTAVALGVGGAAGLSGSSPLETLSTSSAVRYVVSAAAVTAMLGVILNLLLGISRVVLAMARRGDLPRGLAVVQDQSPRRAVLVTGIAIAGLALIGSVKTTWTFSAFSVLVYYAIANLCALRQPPAERIFPRAVPIFGLVCCVALALFIVVLR